MKVSYLLAAVAILGLAGFAMAAKGNRGNKVPTGLMGKVVSVTGTDVTVKAKTGDVVVKTDDSTAISIDGADGKKVADLKKGMMVTVTPETGTATKIVAKTATKKPK
jgi:RNase P/RNase MRP subunit p29